MKGKRFVQVWAVLALLASLGIGVGGASSAGATSAVDELGAEAAAGSVHLSGLAAGWERAG